MTMLSPMSDHSSSSARMTGHIGGCVLETVSSSDEEEEGSDHFDEASLKGESGSVVVAAMDISQRSARNSRGRGREGRGPVLMEDAAAADHSQSSSSSSSSSSVSSLGGGFGGMDTSIRSHGGVMLDTSMRAMEKDTHEDLSYIFRNTIFARGSSLLHGSTGNLLGMDHSTRSSQRSRRRSSFSSVVTTASRQSMSDRGIPLTKNRPKQPINPNVALLCDNNLTSRQKQKQRRSSHKFSSSSSSSSSSGGLLGKVGSILFGGSGNRRSSSQTQKEEQEHPQNFAKNQSWQLQQKQQNPLRQSGNNHNNKRVLRGL